MDSSDCQTILSRHGEASLPHQALERKLSRSDMEVFQAFFRIFKAMDECSTLSERAEGDSHDVEDNEKAPDRNKKGSATHIYEHEHSPTRRDEEISKRENRRDFIRACQNFQAQLVVARAKFRSLGGTRTVVQSLSDLHGKVSNVLKVLKKLRKPSDGDSQKGKMSSMSREMNDLREALVKLDYTFKNWDPLKCFDNSTFRLMEDHLSSGKNEIDASLNKTQGRQRTYFNIFDKLLPLLANDMAVIAAEIKAMSESRLPYVQAAEENDVSRYLSMTTIATFFSGITATTLQFSYSQTDSTLAGLVNVFWYTSLVFSISSAINSLLGMTWRKSSIDNSTCKLPQWSIVWLDKAPMIFLVASAVAFIAGLLLFTFLSSQWLLVPLFSSGLVALHILGLSVLCWYFLRELKSDGPQKPPIKRKQTMMTLSKRTKKISGSVYLRLRRLRCVVLRRIALASWSSQNLRLSLDGCHVASLQDEGYGPLVIHDIPKQSPELREVLFPCQINQIVWSPKGGSLLAVGKFEVYHYSLESHSFKLVKNPMEDKEDYRIHDAKWFPDGERFLCVGRETSRIYTVANKPKRLRDVSIPSRTVLAANLLVDQKFASLAQLDSTPSNKHVRIQDFSTSSSTTLETVQNSAISVVASKQNDLYEVLVGFNDTTPPKLFRPLPAEHCPKNANMDDAYDGSDKIRDYEGKFASDFTGTVTFGGPQERLVLASTRDNQLHIWDRHSGKQLQCIRPSPMSPRDARPVSLAWRPDEALLQVAIGYRDGSVRAETMYYEKQAGYLPRDPSTSIVEIEPADTLKPQPHEDGMQVRCKVNVLQRLFGGRIPARNSAVASDPEKGLEVADEDSMGKRSPAVQVIELVSGSSILFQEDSQKLSSSDDDARQKDANK